MKYLILGANGLIGQQFARLCKEKNIEFVGTCYSRKTEGLIPFNRLDFDHIPVFFDQIAPDVVIDCAGLAGGVNYCEENPETGRKYHVISTQIMADWAKQHNSIFAYISTDYVFDGETPPYKEEDNTNPLNLYGKLKLEAELYIKKTLDRYVIARTTNVFGWDPQTRTPNFLMNLVNTLKEKDSADVPAFLYGNPTYALDLAAGMMDLIEHNHYGLYHIVGPGYINRYDWAVKLLEMANLEGKTIHKIESPPQNMVPRPLKSNLDTTKFRNVSNIKLNNIDEGLRLFLDSVSSVAKLFS